MLDATGSSTSAGTPTPAPSPTPTMNSIEYRVVMTQNGERTEWQIQNWHDDEHEAVERWKHIVKTFPQRRNATIHIEQREVGPWTTL